MARHYTYELKLPHSHTEKAGKGELETITGSGTLSEIKSRLSSLGVELVESKTEGGAFLVKLGESEIGKILPAGAVGADSDE